MEEILDILGKKLKGEASPEELTALQKWLDSDPQNQTLANELTAAWDRSEDGGFDWDPDVDTAWNRFSNEVNFGSSDEQYNSGSGGFGSMWKIAASIAIVVGVALAAFFIMGSGDTVWTSQDTKLAVTLPDGSTVHLDHHSEIIVPADFNEDERNIILTGEAFFEVEPDKHRPFIIKCQDSKTTVLGTSFNIRELEGKVVQIDVVTGKVNFAKGANSVELTTGERAITDGDGVAKSTYSLVDPSLYEKRKMQFDEQKLSEVFPLMEQYFGVIIETKNDNIENCTFHGVFTVPELIEMCEVIKEATGNNYQIVGQKVVFSGDGCSD